MCSWKDRYYCDKFGVDDGMSSKFRREMAHHYVRGLCWVFHYYYKGVASWTWFYPYHYAPFASDLVNIDEFTIEFDKSSPFRPIEQLMGVLPARSAHALPPACRELMMDPSSPIIDFYPEDFKQDPNGKRFEWQWVALLPFIDETRLIAAVQSVEVRVSR